MRHTTRTKILTCCLAMAASFSSPAADASALRPDEPRLAVCFAPGTTPEMVEEVTRKVATSQIKSSLGETLGRFRIATKWTNTATDGSVPTTGDPLTLTWSIVPDGTSISGGAGEPSAPSDLIAFLDGIYGDSATWLALFDQIFARWSQLSGVTYVYEPNDDGASLSSLSGSLGVRGDLRIGGHFVDGNPVDGSILAYNFFPNDGDMVIDTGDTFYQDTSSSSLGLRNVLAHEHGHGMGFAHVCPEEETKLMEPLVSFAFDGPQHDDIQAVQRNYGDPDETNDTTGTATDLGTISSRSITNRSIDDNGDIDFYSFDINNGATLDLTLTPVGLSYLEGQQNFDGSCSTGTNFDSLEVHDLGLRVLGPDGSTVLASATSNPRGVAETLSNVVLPAAGTYFIEIDGDGTDSIQIYDLDITVDVCTGSIPAPGGVDANANGDNRVDLVWDDSGDASVTAYQLHRSTAMSFIAGPATLLTTIVDTLSTGSYLYSDTTVSGSQTYYYQLIATNNFGACTSTASTEVSAAATGDCIEAPIFSGADSATAQGSALCGIDLAWSAASSNCGNSVIYNVYRSTASAFTPSAGNQIATGLACCGHTDISLDADQTYFYVVRAIDDFAGANEDNNTLEVSASNSALIDLPSTDKPVAIPDNDAGGIDSILTVSDSGKLEKVAISVDISHTWRGDLIVELTSPKGTTVRLHDFDSGDSANDIDTTYPTLTSPAGPGTMSDFNGEEMSGNWVLSTSDNVVNDTGTLNGWTLHLTGPTCTFFCETPLQSYSNQTISGTIVETACYQLQVSDLTVTQTGLLTLEAPGGVLIGDGVTVDAGGEVKIRNE